MKQLIVISIVIIGSKRGGYSVTEDEKLLRNMVHEFEEGFNSGDVDSIMRFYADTYVDVNLRNPVQTKAERRVYYAQVMARPGIHLNVRPDVVVAWSLSLSVG